MAFLVATNAIDRFVQRLQIQIQVVAFIRMKRCFDPSPALVTDFDGFCMPSGQPRAKISRIPMQFRAGDARGGGDGFPPTSRTQRRKNVSPKPQTPAEIAAAAAAAAAAAVVAARVRSSSSFVTAIPPSQHRAAQMRRQDAIACDMNQRVDPRVRADTQRQLQNSLMMRHELQASSRAGSLRYEPRGGAEASTMLGGLQTGLTMMEQSRLGGPQGQSKMAPVDVSRMAEAVTAHHRYTQEGAGRSSAAAAMSGYDSFDILGEEYGIAGMQMPGMGGSSLMTFDTMDGEDDELGDGWL